MNTKMKWASRLLVLTLVAVLTLGMATPAYAADVREGDVVIVSADEVIEDDLIIGAQRIEVYGTIVGDAVLFGQTVIMDGRVEGSLVIGAQVVEVGGEVTGSAYIGGQSVDFGDTAVIGRNLYFGGLSAVLAQGAAVERSAYIAGYQAALNGSIDDDAYVGLGSLAINGAIGGNVYGTVSVDADADTTWIPYMPDVVLQDAGLTISEGAEIGGEMLVQLEEVANEVDIDLPDEFTDFQPQEAVRTFTANRVRTRVGDFLGLLLVGLLFLAVLPESVDRMRVLVEGNAAGSLGWGLLLVILFFTLLPAVIGLLILAAILGGLVSLGTLVPEILGLGGATLFMIGAGFSFLMSTVSKIVVSYLVGRLILVRLKQTVETYWVKAGALALGLVLYELVRAIPFGFGWVAGLLVTWIGVGAAYFLLREKFSRKDVEEVPES